MSKGLLLSGGLDSTAIAYWLRPDFAFTVDYGQMGAKGEIHAARQVCKAIGIEHEVISVDCRPLGSGDLFGKPPALGAPMSEWLPFRNQLLLTLAGMRAIPKGAQALLFGAVKPDSVHADGTKEFFEAMDKAFALQEGGLRILAPAIEMTTAELIRVSNIPLSILGWAHSCDVSASACGRCGSCSKYYGVMKELGVEKD
ncbi:MAG: 7-cyano-7-deazaguanine synthase [Acidobacteriota bacterium]|nr:7-cyano-7-deazaguanine synthase [Acidobacteriota bacterium]